MLLMYEGNAGPVSRFEPSCRPVSIEKWLNTLGRLPERQLLFKAIFCSDVFNAAKDTGMAGPESLFSEIRNELRYASFEKDSGRYPEIQFDVR
jgi:hypothetical protein